MTITGPNPYIGPKPFETGRHIYGRDHEIEDLYYLLSAERIVLLHSPSGAGKSSLIQAGLIPRLTPRFDVWGPTRVNQRPPSSQPGDPNRYVHSAILGFEQGIPETRRRSEDQLAQMTLAEYVKGRPRRRSAPENIVLIFDQFEEILTADPTAIDAKREFFRQLGDMLLDPRLWGLFALREDYLAPLDPYAQQVPTHLKIRFRLDLLSRDATREAIAGPALESGRQYAPEAVDKLINDLAMVKVQQPDGSFIEQLGQYVEPLQLQVVCRRLWDQMPADDLLIDMEDVTRLGDVSEALSGYYSGEVSKIAAGDEHIERNIREWIGNKLIRTGGIRGQVLKGAGDSEGLDNELIAQLVNTHMVRGEQRTGAVWYELAHDRLIEPVALDNEKWFNAHLHKLQKVALIWDSNGRPDNLLMVGPDLDEANLWKQSNESNLTDVESKFLDSSNAKQSSLAQARSLRKMKIGGWILAGLMVIFLLFGFSLWNLYQQAVISKNEADKQSQIAKDQTAIANTNVKKAREEERKARELSEAARLLAARELAEKVTRLAGQRKLDELSEVFKSIETIADNRFDFAVAATELDATGTGGVKYFNIEVYPDPASIKDEKESISRINYIFNHETFYQNLRVGAPQNDFKYSYTGWGCLHEVVAIIEYKDLKRAPSISIFDMCDKWTAK